LLKTLAKKNSYNDFHQNLTNCLVADTTCIPRTENKVGSCSLHFLRMRSNCEIKKADPQAQTKTSETDHTH